MDVPRGDDGAHASTVVQGSGARRLRPGPPESAYVLGVASIATWGFGTGSTAGILLAVLLALPLGVPALVGYYLAYSLLAQVPGANAASSSGSGWCSPGGACHESSAGTLAVWFTPAMEVVGVLALVAAAVLNVVALRAVLARPRT